MYNGILFDSEGEMKMYRDLLLPGLENGTIRSVERQKEFVLSEGFTHDGQKIRPITYKADFVVFYACGRTVVYDFKGMAEPIARLKRKMFWKKYPELPFQWVGYSKIDGGYRDWDYIQKCRKQRRKAAQ